MNLRFVKKEDSEALRRLYATYVKESVITFEYEVPGREEFAQRIETIAKDYPYLVCEIDDAIAGYAYAHRHMERAAYQWNVELSIYLDERYQKRGIGKALYTALLEILKLQHIRNAYSCITVPNAASLALHASFGFVEIGRFPHSGYKHEAWHDIVWLGKDLGSDNQPQPLCSIQEVDDKVIKAILQQAQQGIKNGCSRKG